MAKVRLHVDITSNGEKVEREVIGVKEAVDQTAQSMRVLGNVSKNVLSETALKKELRALNKNTAAYRLLGGETEALVRRQAKVRSFILRNISGFANIDPQSDAIKEMVEGYKQLGVQVENLKRAEAAMLSLKNATKLAAVGVVGLTGAFVTFAVKSASVVEEAETSLQSLVGGVQKSKRLVDNLMQTAATTPFRFSELVDIARQVAVVTGGDIARTIKTIRMLGDASAGSMDRLQRITRQYTRMIDKNRAMLEELNFISEAGVPIFRVLGEMMGKTTLELRKMASEGQITADMVTTAFEKMTGAGGLFGGMLERMSQTAKGQLNKVIDSFMLVSAEIGEVYLPAIKKTLETVLSLLKEKERFIKVMKVAGNIIAVVSGLLVMYKTKVMLAAFATVMLGTAMNPAYAGLFAAALGVATIALGAYITKMSLANDIAVEGYRGDTERSKSLFEMTKAVNATGKSFRRAGEDIGYFGGRMLYSSRELEDFKEKLDKLREPDITRRGLYGAGVPFIRPSLYGGEGTMAEPKDTTISPAIGEKERYDKMYLSILSSYEEFRNRLRLMRAQEIIDDKEYFTKLLEGADKYQTDMLMLMEKAHKFGIDPSLLGEGEFLDKLQRLRAEVRGVAGEFFFLDEKIKQFNAGQVNVEKAAQNMINNVVRQGLQEKTDLLRESSEVQKSDIQKEYQDRVRDFNQHSQRLLQSADFNAKEIELIMKAHYEELKKMREDHLNDIERLNQRELQSWKDTTTRIATGSIDMEGMFTKMAENSPSVQRHLEQMGMSAEDFGVKTAHALALVGQAAQKTISTISEITSLVGQIQSNIMQQELIDSQAIIQRQINTNDKLKREELKKIKQFQKRGLISQKKFKEEEQKINEEFAERQLKLQYKMQYEQQVANRQMAIHNRDFRKSQAIMDLIGNVIAAGTRGDALDAFVQGITGVLAIKTIATTPIPRITMEHPDTYFAETGGRFVVPRTGGAAPDRVGLRVNEGETIDVTPAGEEPSQPMIQVFIGEEQLDAIIQRRLDDGYIEVPPYAIRGA